MINKFEFTPNNGFVDSSAFPNPQGEDVTREQLQRLHDQTRDFINNLIDLMNNYDLDHKVSSLSVKYLRVKDGIVEWSIDNESWFSLGSSEGGGSMVPSGGTEGQALIRGTEEYTARWDDLTNHISLASDQVKGLMSSQDKILLDKLNELTKNGESINADKIVETDMYTLLKNTERALLFNLDGDALFYSIVEADEIFQSKINMGTTLPESAEEGDIFLLYEETEETV